MSISTPTELERFHDFIGEKIAIGMNAISPEDALDQFRSQRTLDHGIDLGERADAEQFLEELHRAGILDAPRPIPAKAESDTRPLIEIEGPPLSQTIIEDRR